MGQTLRHWPQAEPAVEIDLRPVLGFRQGDGLLLAGLHTSPAAGAGSGPDGRTQGPDDPEIHDLRPGTGVGASGQGNAEFMVQLQRALDLSSSGNPSDSAIPDNLQASEPGPD